MKRVSDLDLRHLRIFVTVAEAGGFAAAESHLNVSTSTISVHMSNLEERIGIRLCERGRSGFRLTERGKIVFKETKRLLETLDDYTGIIAGVQSLIAGRVAIGMTDCLITHPDFPVSEAIREFNKTDNDVQFQLVIAPRQALETDVLEGRLHTAIVPFVRRVSGLHFAPLFSERHEVYCGAGHPLFKASIKDIQRADLAAYPAVIRKYHDELDLGKFQIAKQREAVFSMEAMLTLLLSGGYIGYLPVHYAAPSVKSGKLSLINRKGLGYDSKHMLITKPGGRKPVAVATLISLIKRICERQ